MKRSKQFPFGDHFINSHSLFSFYYEEKVDVGHSWDLLDNKG